MIQIAKIQLKLYRQVIVYLICLGLTFGLTFGALFFFDVPSDWRTPIILAVATICIVVQVGLGAQLIMASIQLNTEYALSKINASDGDGVGRLGDG
jgi:hypothetical protein